MDSPSSGARPNTSPTPSPTPTTSSLFSNRLYGSIPTLPDRYPLSARYYKLLFAGDLGFEVDYVAEAHPNFLGVQLRP